MLSMGAGRRAGGMGFVRVGQLGVRVAVEFAGYFQLEL